MNYDDAERRAYVKADPTAALLARIADLEHERDELRADLETVREEAYAEGYSAGYEEGLVHDA